MARRRSLFTAVATAACAAVSILCIAHQARADDGGYLINVTLGPGNAFANAYHALSYGRGICDKVRAGVGFPQIVADIKTDLNTADEFQSSYLISQAAEELCPELIWQVRESAARYAG